MRNRFGAEPAAQKAGLLRQLNGLTVCTASDARRLHLALCFLRAFPDSRTVLEQASALLARFHEVVAGLGDSHQHHLTDTGLAGTNVHYPFSYEVANWMARRFPGIAAIDWEELHDTARLDELLEYVLHPAEADYFDSGQVSTEEWIRIAAEHQQGTDFDWLMTQLGEHRSYQRFWTQLYNAAELPLRCTLSDTAISVTRNVFPVRSIRYRYVEMKGRIHRAQREIARPVRSMRLLDKRDGQKLIDVAMSSLAMRHRETIHFDYANAREVWLADVGKGVAIAITGLLPGQRYPLECTMGFLILSNGVPIGYGGSSMLYRQLNTGINVFEEYRGSEAAWLWVQVMRVFHALSGCTRFIANPYQFGAGNAEALKSGAFWFYYRLGYRPVDRDVRALAREEHLYIRKRRHHRTPVAVLKQLATCDMHLVLPAARQAEFFDEALIETSSLLATQQLALSGHQSRRKAQDELGRQLAADLGVVSMDGWTGEERRWFMRMAPVVAATHPAAWPLRDRRALVSLMRAKGGQLERDFVKRLGRHERFFTALKKACRRASG